MNNIPVIGILRGIEPSFFKDVMSASFASGLNAIEITINTLNAEKMLSSTRPLVPEGKWLGMGTVRNILEAQKARDAGAMFMVTPNLDREVIEFANKENIPVIAGALTPTEVYNAWDMGADMIKVFPCGAMGGARYIRDLLGPFDKMPLVAVGGVSLENVAEYFQKGARAVGVSSSLFGKKILKEKDIRNIKSNVKKFTDLCQEAIRKQ